MRFEERIFLKFIKIAWIPRGPVYLDESIALRAQAEFLKKIKKKNFFVCVLWPWRQTASEEAHSYTMWVDLTKGKDQLWNNFDKQLRYDIRRAEKEGVVVEQTTTVQDIQAFYELCHNISNEKKFKLNTSFQLMLTLLQPSSNPVTECQLFVSRYANQVCAGAFIIRCGKRIHYMWGASNRKFAKQRVGEILQWKVIEWGLAQQCDTYDLEGVNPIVKDGVYFFKKKLGGNMVGFERPQIYWLNNLGKLMEVFLKMPLFKYFFNKAFNKI